MIEDGPCQRESSEYPCSIAVASVNGLNADPACRPEPPSPVARFTLDTAKFFPPYIARTAPLRGSIATTAAAGSPGVSSRLATASSAYRCICESSVVVTCSPPPNTSPSSYSASNDRRV